MTAYSFPSVLQDGLILIVGLGETGVAAACWCAAHGASLRVVDTRSTPPGLQVLQDSLDVSKVDFYLGPDALSSDVLDDVRMLVLSPGLEPESKPVQRLLQAAEEKNIDVVGEIELFARALNDLAPQGYTPKLLAVTGTNGKTTVTAMARQLALACGYSAVAAGNIGPAALTALRTAVQAGTLPDVWILELSSFQLVTTRSLRADAAAVLNISQDHIDWHGSYEAYIQAKKGLLVQAKVSVINRSDAVVRAMVASLDLEDVRSLGDDIPAFAGDLGLENNQDVMWLCAAQILADDHGKTGRTRRSSGSSASEKAVRPAGSVVRLMPVDALRVRGHHNALNAQAAMILVRVLGGGWAPMLHALRDYEGEPHRMEYLRTVAGIDFINDSKGTNVGATVAALEGMRQPIVLIAGGLAKGQDFTAFAHVAKKTARAVILIGKDVSPIVAALNAAGVRFEHVDTLARAVSDAFKVAHQGDAVLLSPACASMDMFRNYVHRGQCFADQVAELALDQGEVA